ncbi:scaffolding protein [Arthrobacter phage KeAlii]|uniref:Scaffolding protein n=1 Tax=Arthrobacter phage KeAlii TaxID=2885973 RepID=A0AA95B8B3_9CAUD|nr:head scaffolding protein [Arthrobacter phage KeAlii]UDL14612.1 scaffolding protein [Arthrobacter phage KeAlii]
MANTEAQNNEAAAEGAKPEGGSNPWGDDFDAEKAWRLVQNLRAEVTGLKTERDNLKTERDNLKSEKDAAADEGKSELQKLQDRIAEIEKASKDKDRDLALQKVLRKHPELEEFADLLTGETEEELSQKAERLAKIGKKSDDDGEQNPGSSTELPGMPKPNLVPGHGGGDSEAFDPVAIAKAARR